MTFITANEFIVKTSEGRYIGDVPDTSALTLAPNISPRFPGVTTL